MNTTISVNKVQLSLVNEYLKEPLSKLSTKSNNPNTKKKKVINL